MKRTEGLRFVYRHFPISNVHPYAVRAAEAAEAAWAQGRFWEMHDALFALDQPLDDEHLSRSARKAGLDMERYAREMAEGVYTKIVNVVRPFEYGTAKVFQLHAQVLLIPRCQRGAIALAL